MGAQQLASLVTQFRKLRYVHWINWIEPIGCIPPAEAEAEATDDRQLSGQATEVEA